jgi:GNAT superfamily N-acetyltransferase
MQPEELQIAIDWAQHEGWNPGLHDAETFYQADPNGFFVGELDHQIIAVGSAVRYDQNFAFCGLYIVHPDFRGQGYGLQLTQERLRYVDTRNAGIDGVVENISIYERIGYRLAYHNMRYQGLACEAKADQRAIVALSDITFADLVAYDRLCFPAPRDAFLQAWIKQQDSRAIAYVKQGQLMGYAVRRKCNEGHKIGPLFADSFIIAKHLITALQQDIVGDAIFLDITDINPAARRLVEQQQMQQVFSTGRMYLKGQPNLEDEKIFGITTFELG